MTITHVILARLYKKVIIDTAVIKLSTSIHNHLKMYQEERKLIPVLKQILNPFAGIKSLQATLPAGIFYWGF